MSNSPTNPPRQAPATADLVSLFGGQGGGGLAGAATGGGGEAFRQATVLTFNGTTKENTVEVGGATLTNLPSVAGIGTISPGDAVILLKYRSSWAILGRIVSPAP